MSETLEQRALRIWNEMPPATHECYVEPKIKEFARRLLAAETAEPVAWIEHHKGGDNLVWEQSKLPCSRRSRSSPRPTPETEAHLSHLNLPDGRKVGIPNETVALLRSLESRLAAANAELAKLRQEREGMMLVPEEPTNEFVYQTAVAAQMWPEGFEPSSAYIPYAISSTILMWHRAMLAAAKNKRELAQEREKEKRFRELAMEYLKGMFPDEASLRGVTKEE